MNSIIVIPARFGSQRFPGKPLAVIKGKSLIHRVWDICKAVRGVEEVLIATDSQEISDHCSEFKARVVMTSERAQNGSERIFEAVEKLKIQPKIIVNVQGDAVLTPPHIIEALVAAMHKAVDFEVATPAAKWSSESGRSSTYVVFDQHKNALYFSRALIPNVRDGDRSSIDIFKHIGIYAYSYTALKEYLGFNPGPLEQAEKLEQLRFLENGRKIKVVPVDFKGRTPCSIDLPDDVLRAEALIEKEGELI